MALLPLEYAFEYKWFSQIALNFISFFPVTLRLKTKPADCSRAFYKEYRKMNSRLEFSLEIYGIFVLLNKNPEKLLEYSRLSRSFIGCHAACHIGDCHRPVTIWLIGELSSSLGASSLKNFSTVSGCHSFSEAMFLFSLSLLGLVCSLHDSHLLVKFD